MNLAVNDDNKNKSVASHLASELHSRIGLVNSNEEEFENKNNRFFYSVKDYKILLEKDINAENLSHPNVFNLPHAPEWCSGVVNIRGIIIPVIKMHYLLNTRTSISLKNSRLLLLKNKNIEPIIIQIDKLPTMINIDNYSISSNKEDSPEWIEKTFTYNKNQVLEVNHADLLNKLKALH